MKQYTSNPNDIRIPICVFADNTQMYFSQGRFDDYCIKLDDPSHHRYGIAPTDKKYFSYMKNLSHLYGSDRLYYDFIKIYNCTTASVSQDTLNFIHEISRTYTLSPDHSLKIEQLFSILYAGMIAEENREKTHLGKRIKRLGVHLLLQDNLSPQAAADYMRGMAWQKIDAICKQKGF